MNWGDLGKTLIGLGLPTLGTALGGPLGGAAGKMLADALGTSATPEAVSKAIVSDPVAQQKMAEAEIEWAKTVAAFAQSATDQSAGINETMRAELAGGVSWYHWRHLNGFTVQLYALAILVGFCTAMWAGKPSTADYVLLMGVVTGVFLALCALNGYVAMDTTRRTTAAAAGTEAGTLLGTLLGKLKR